MRLLVKTSGRSRNYYVIRDVVRNGKRSTETVEKIGTYSELIEMHPDPEMYAKAYVEELNKKKEQNKKVYIEFNSKGRIPIGKQYSYNIGYLFLQQIYCKLGLPKLCKTITQDYSYKYDLDTILSRMVYGRILFPSSKLSCLEQSQTLLEGASFDLQHMYRALSVIAENSDQIQSELYKNSKKLVERKTGILYYDCTNFFFEIEQEDDFRKYGPSKEHRPNPIVQMGLFMDASGIPLAFDINPGNINEQQTLKPLELQLQRDFGLSKFVVCTDAGLSSNANRKFNNWGERAFITTQSIKKLSKELKEWCLSPEGWKLPGNNKLYNIKQIKDTPENRNKIFYKERLLDGYDKEKGIRFDQNLIVTFSLKYRNYHRKIRGQQIDRAINAIENGTKLDRVNQNDYKRLIKQIPVTANGEIAEDTILEINEDLVAKEAKYDGFYAVCTNLLDDSMEDIVKINHNRWEIEETFRLIKSELKARPVYLSREDRIKAHFMTCFIALLIYRILEKNLDEEFTSTDIISTLKNMNITSVGKDGYIPSYVRTEVTDKLHEVAGFYTDKQLLSESEMKRIVKKSKGK